ncbi:hypothetical protein I7I48_01075 [Histoplasma ohiense]|nr:hypothetical protein I7I48_01075 [Histoplasma ohiense (nom. inval.)]
MNELKICSSVPCNLKRLHTRFSLLQRMFSICSIFIGHSFGKCQLIKLCEGFIFVLYFASSLSRIQLISLGDMDVLHFIHAAWLSPPRSRSAPVSPHILSFRAPSKELPVGHQSRVEAHCTPCENS